MANGHESTDLVSWNDPKTGDWEPTMENEAGCMWLPFGIGAEPEIHETPEGHIRLGETFELRYLGLPFVYGIFMLDGSPAKYSERHLLVLGAT